VILCLRGRIGEVMMRNAREMRISTPEPDRGIPISELTTQRLADHHNHTEFISSRGETIIADGIVSKITSLALREIPQVHEVVDQHQANRFLTFLGRGRDDGEAVRVKVGNREVSIQLRIAVDHGVSIPEIAESVRRCVVDRVESMTGLSVKEVDLDIRDLYFPADIPPADVQIEAEHGDS
jgi:uncharacterized alkaline shock family protein YloU